MSRWPRSGKPRGAGDRPGGIARRPVVIGALLLAGVLAAWLGGAQGEEKRMKTGFFKQGPEVELEAAIRSDDRAGIGRAIAAGARIDARGLRNMTPLMIG